MTSQDGAAASAFDPRALLARVGPGALWLIFAVVAGGALFYEGVVNLWNAWQVPEYSHGPLIPVISGYLFLRQLKGVPSNPGPVTDRWPGVLVLLFAAALAFAANVAQIEVIVAGSIIIWVAGLVLISFGWKRGLQFWPPVLHLGFMLPLPFFLFWQVSIALQLVSSEIGVAVIRLMDIPVFLEGNIIDLGVYKLHVAEACSGLRYLFPVFSFTYIFAVLYQGSVWHKAILLLAAAPITILMNSFRVGVIGVLVDAYGIEMAEGFLHLFEGWVIFIACILMMIGLSKVLQLLSGDRRSLAEVLDVDFSGLGAQMARVSEIRPSFAWIGSAVVVLAIGIGWSPMTRPDAPEIAREPFLLFPGRVGDFQVANRMQLPDEIEQVLRADDYLSINLVSREETQPVDLFVAWYENQTSASIHSPEVCLPAGGWEMSNIDQYKVSLPLDGGALEFEVNRAIIQKGLSQQLVYYYFDQTGRRLTSDIMTKLYLFYDGFMTGRRDGALVRFTTPIGANEDVAMADARLQKAMRAAIPEMPRFISTSFDLKN